MDILIVAHFINLPNENGNNRFNYLADVLANENQEDSVEVITSSFSHMKKVQRNDLSGSENINYKISLCFEPGYPKNVCLRRFYSHYIFGRSLKKYLENRKKPDVIYCAVPSLDAAYIAMKFAKKNGIRFIIDIQDLWPEAFQMVFRVPVISDMIFFPMKWRANQIYSYADEIVAVSDTYCQRVKSKNKKVNDTHTVFLGTDLKKFDENVKHNKVQRTDDDIWLGYCVTLGHSYDLKCIIDAMAKLSMQGVSNLKFVVMGDGPLRDSFERYSKESGVNVEFTGRLPYDEMCGRLAACDIAINCISKGAAQSIINKHADYAAAGIPVVSTQECKEYKELVEEYQMGFNCRNNDSDDLADKIWMLIRDSNLRTNLGKNARICAEEKFDRNLTYKKNITEY